MNQKQNNNYNYKQTLNKQDYGRNKNPEPTWSWRLPQIDFGSGDLREHAMLLRNTYPTAMSKFKSMSYDLKGYIRVDNDIQHSVSAGTAPTLWKLGLFRSSVWLSCLYLSLWLPPCPYSYSPLLTGPIFGSVLMAYISPEVLHPPRETLRD